MYVYLALWCSRYARSKLFTSSSPCVDFEWYCEASPSQPLICVRVGSCYAHDLTRASREDREKS